MTIEILATNIVAGIAGTAGLALTSYAKARTPTGELEKFDKTKFAATIALGGVIGGLTTLGITATPEMIAGLSASITLAIENVIKAIKRYCV